MANRFHKHGEAYFRFITTPGIDPTNNLAEQAIRFVVIDRRITQGTRSETGRRWCERIRTRSPPALSRAVRPFSFCSTRSKLSLRHFAAISPAVSPRRHPFRLRFPLVLHRSVAGLRRAVNAYEFFM